jgi:tripartite-type tricarboxylate transporter receptor subunit TctC
MVTGRQFLTIAMLAAALLAAPFGVPAQAQDSSYHFPDRPVRLIVPFAAGGGVDIIARLVAPKLGEMWGQAIVVENKPGALGTVASEYVAHQPADGYTLLIGVISPA